MRLLRWTTVVLLTLGTASMCVAPGAAAAVVAANKDHPSSDAPWLIGLLILVVLLMGVGGLWLLRSNSRTRGTSHFRD